MVDLLFSAEAWAAFTTLVALEIVLGIDNLIFISIVAGKVAEERRDKVRHVGIGLALIMRLGFLASIVWLVGLTEPVFDLGLSGTLDSHGEPSFETAFSWRDIILISGGLFLVWKSTSEIREKLEPEGDFLGEEKINVGSSIAAVIVQIIILDLVFSIDSILTAVGMVDELPIMIAAVIVAVMVMLIASGPVMRFINRNPSVVMLALAFLLMIGMVLIADGFGRHVPKAYIYAAMAFSVFVESLNMVSRNRRVRLAKERDAR